MLNIYLSAPVFTQVQRQWNRQLARDLEGAIKDAAVILPQDFMFAGKYNDKQNFPDIFRQCVAAMDEADVVLAVLDGPDVDSGVSFEIGYAFAMDKRILGVRTDFRQNQERGVNLMLSRACTNYLLELSFGEDVGQLVKDIAGKLLATLKVDLGRR